MLNKNKAGKNGYILASVVMAIIILIVVSSMMTEEKAVEINQLSDLNGITVGVQSGTLYEENLLDKVPGANVVYYTDPYSMLLSVEQGKLDAALAESISFTIEQSAHPSLTPLDEDLGEIGISAAFGETDRMYQLYDQFEDFIRDCKEDGTMDELQSYWLNNYSAESCVVDKSGITGENGTISIAVETTYEPFEYVVDGEYQGYDIDLIYRFARKYGYEPVIVGMDFDAISAALSTGKYDMGMNLLSVEERKDAVLLSTPYADFKIQVIVAGGETEDVGFFDSIISSFRKTFFVENRWKSMAEGLGITLMISVLSIVIGFVLGTLAYMLCYEGDPLANRIMNILSEVSGGLPSVVILMIMYYIVFGELSVGNIFVSVFTFTLMFTCSTFSIIKSGVAALGDGQYEAARAQGMSSIKTFLLIIYPQVLLNQMSTLHDEMASLVKETAIVGYIAVMDLTKASDIIRGRTFEPFFPLIVIAVVYFLLIKLLAFILSSLLKGINPDTRNAEKIIEKKIKD